VVVRRIHYYCPCNRHDCR